MGRVDGKVALITGAARGQGRAHAVELAREGADIVALDLCANPEFAQYPASTEADLEETVRLVEEQGRRIVAHKGDVRNLADVEGVVAAGIEQFGYIDVAVINHGIALIGTSWEITEEEWATVVDINLTGAWRVAKAVVPAMIEADRGGSIMFTTSGLALRGSGHLSAYSATKTGLMGLCREMAVELGPHNVRVNTIHITAVQTQMMDYEGIWKVFTPDMEGAPMEERRARMYEISQMQQMLPVPFLQPEDVSKGVLFLASDDSKMVTGTPFRVDGGFASK